MIRLFRLVDGEAVEVKAGTLAWAEVFEKTDVRIAETFVGDVRVSTVFLGVGLGEPPRMFETMVFGGKSDRAQRRYRSKREALDGHAEIVKSLEASEDTGI